MTENTPDAADIARDAVFANAKARNSLGVDHTSAFTIALWGARAMQAAMPAPAGVRVPDGWVAVPLVGAEVKASHPITVLNPDPTFEVIAVEVDSRGARVRGDKTCWFGMKGVKPALEPAVEREGAGPKVYTVGENTMARVFTPSGLTNVSDLQAVLDAVEAALTPTPAGAGDLVELPDHVAAHIKWLNACVVREQARATTAESDLAALRAEVVPGSPRGQTFAVQHNPNCPSPWLVRLPGESGVIDLKPYGGWMVAHETGDRLGFGLTFDAAARAAFALRTEDDDRAPAPDAPGLVENGADGDPDHECRYLCSLLDDDNLMSGDIMGAMHRIQTERIDPLATRITSDAATIASLRAEVERLSVPNAVHINMLRGTIAKPTWAQIKHLYPEATAAEAERDALKAEVARKDDALKEADFAIFAHSPSIKDRAQQSIRLALAPIPAEEG